MKTLKDIYCTQANDLILRSPYKDCKYCVAIAAEIQGISTLDALIAYLADIEQNHYHVPRSFASELLDGVV